MQFVVFVLITIFSCTVYDVSAQNDIDISQVLETLGINPQDVTNILDLFNIQEICIDIQKLSRDDLCTKQLKIVCENEPFLLRMIDASSKYPYTGSLVSTRINYGTYDECINLDLTQNGIRILGKHCLGGLVIPTTELNDSQVFEKAYKLSTCIPDGCSAQDLTSILLNLSSTVPIINNNSCSTKESWKILGADDYAFIIFLLVIVMVMVISTVYDVYLFYTSQESLHILLKAFSVYHNGKKLLQVSRGPSDQIKVIHGMRVIGIMWIIAGHAFSYMASSPGIHTDFLTEFEWTRKSTYVTTAYLAVDTFFFISGFLLAYQYFKQEPQPLMKHLKKLPGMYLHRYLRLTPPVAVAFFFCITVLNHAGNGPAYNPIVQLEKDRCLNHWWSFFLYLQNYVNNDDICMINTWYLSADWQLFLISPVILFPTAVLIKRNFYWVMGQLLLLNIFFIVAPIGFKFLFNDFTNNFETHSYLIDYFTGFMLGVFMREKNNMKYPFKTVATLIIWCTALLAMLLSVLAYQEILLLVHYRNDPSYRSYSIIIRAFWCFGLSWVIYSCHNGYGGFINWLLTTPLVQVLSKLTYCMYIVHVCPTIYLKITSRLPEFYSQMTGVYTDRTPGILLYLITIGSETRKYKENNIEGSSCQDNRHHYNLFYNSINICFLDTGV